jgi:anthranilate synthase component 1
VTDADPAGGLPDRETFREHAAGERPVVVRAAAEMDVDVAPLAAYAALTGRTADVDTAAGASAGDPGEYAFLLESAGKTAGSDPDGAFRPASASPDRHARFSYVGYDPEAVVTVGADGVDVRALAPDAPTDLLERGLEQTGAGGDAPEGTSASNRSAERSGDALDDLRAAMPSPRLANVPDRERQRLDGGLVGFLGYDAVYDMWLDDVGLERPDSRFPDAEFVLTTRTVAFDHADGAVEFVATPLLREGDDADAVYDALVAERERVADVLADAPDPSPGGFVREGERAGPREEYEEAVERAKEHVTDGDIYQGVISRTRELYGDVDPLGLYAALRDVNPSPYMYLLGHDDLTVVGASPETLVSVSGDRVVANPIAGTCPRGASPVEDRRLAGEMLADEKERAEHTMLVDLARNDVRRVSEPGSIRVEEFMAVLKYSHVQHIESTVTGTLADGADAFDATRATFPAGTLAGAPKIRAMEIIDALEATPRGPYGGGVGYYSWTGDADVAIVIRSATVEHAAPRAADSASSAERSSADSRAAEPRDDGEQSDPRAGAAGGQVTGVREDADRITVRAGAGIVADSDPAAEYEETESKMDGVLAAIEAIERDPAEGSGDVDDGSGEAPAREAQR